MNPYKGPLRAGMKMENANMAREKPAPEPPRTKGGFITARLGGGK